MITVDVTKTPLTEVEAEVVAIPAVAAASLDEDAPGGEPRQPPAPTLGAGAEELAEALGIDLADELAAQRFDGSRGAVARVPTRGAIPADTVLVVGVGKAEDLDLESLRKAAAALADATSRRRTLATTLHRASEDLDARDATQAVTEGLSLASYRFAAYKSNGDLHHLERVELVAGPGRSQPLKDGAARGTIAAAGARLARDLVNAPSGDKRPPMLAERARTELRGTGVKVKILDESALEKGGYGGLLAVGKGSDAPPRLVQLTYEPTKRARRHVALVGKGITFDSGGLSLKPGQGMMTMKMDMGGAAAVLGTVKAAAELELPVRLTGLMALAENMPSATAQRPGDVYTARNGTTVEVLNTDAEGRLVLSDALSHASELEPDIIVDLATLTGAVVIALGKRIGGLMTPDDGLAEQLLEASQRSGEQLWRLPLPDDYREHLDSEIADLKNIGREREAGTVVAGLFLKEFVADGIPWAHLDIAGLAWSDEQYGYIRKGGTGAPVRTLLTWLARR